MVAPILSALARGFTNKQIVQYLLRTFPEYAPQINKALKYGFTPDRIVQYLAKGREGVNQAEGQLTEHEQTRKKDKTNESKLEKIIGGTALGAAGLGLGAGLYGSGALQAIPGLLDIGGQTPSPQPLPPVAPQQIPLPNATTPINPQTIANPAGNMQPAMPLSAGAQQIAQQLQQPSSNAISQVPQAAPYVTFQDVFKEFPTIQNKIHDLVQSGNRDPSTISGFFEKFGGDTVKKIEAKYRKPFVEFVKEYLDTLPPENIDKSKEIIPEKTIDKNEQKVAVLPSGDLANIKSIKGKVVKLDVDGKNKLMNLSKIVESPLPYKDLADLHDDLIKGIEAETGEEVSRMVDWAGYDPKTNSLGFLPHDGPFYTYENLSPERVAQLTDILSTRKSSGDNFIGAWKAGSKSPIGAAMSKLIKELQAERGGKGNEYKHKFETVYSSKEPAIKASKDRKKKAKNEKKEKRKK